MAEHDRRASGQDSGADRLPVPTQHADTPLPRGAVGYVTSPYLSWAPDIWASSEGRRVRSYTFDASSYAADANGDKIIRAGTVLHGEAGLAVARTGDDEAFGVLVATVNARDGDVEIAVAEAGAIREDRCWDNNAYGSVAAGVKTSLAHIQFVTYDF